MTGPGPHRDEEAKFLFQLTREMELLISAALVFALLQLPGGLDDWWWRTSVHVGSTAFFGVFIIYYVGKLVAYGLIAAISAHFLLRGFWVAVMSLRSVYPAGIDRERLDHGDLYRKFYEQRLKTLPELEDRIDKLAASIFGFVFMFLLMFAMLTVWALVAGGIALIAIKLTGNDAIAGPIMIAMFVLYVGLQSFVASVDKTSKKRSIPPKVEAAALRVLRFTHYSTFNFVYAPVFFTYASHSSKRRVSAILVTFLYTMIAIFMVSVFHARGIIGFDSYSYYPSQAREQQLRPMHYDSMRGAEAAATAPTIQSELIEGPYLRLFVPYDAQEDNARMRALCPEVKPLRDEGFFFARRGKLDEGRVRQLDACFDRIYRIELDGKPIAQPGFIFHRHPSGDVAGRLAMIPAGTLTPGRHILTVKHTPVKSVDEDNPADEYYIPFWR